MARHLPAARALVLTALVAAGMSGCTTASSDPPTSAKPSATKPAGLPDPLPTALPLTSKVLIQRSGSGPATLDLTGIVGAAKNVTVDWTCLGSSGLQITDGAKTLVGGGCGTTATSVTTDGAVIPLSISPTLHWSVQVGSTTNWRVVVIGS